ncbi:MAG: hypothetical protein ACFE9N_13950 [Promethearchaeota archaeon]
MEQKSDKKYYLTELGIYAYNSLKSSIDTIKKPDFVHREFKSPILRKLMWITSERFIQFENKDKIFSLIISIIILFIGTILCSLNNFFSFFLFFIEIEQSNIDMVLRILIISSFIINTVIFFTIIEAISRIFYKKNEKAVNFLISFSIILFPLIFYLILHLIFKWSNILTNNIINLIDKILLIIFQVWSLWLLSYSLCVKKGLKIESSLIISLLVHYSGFTIILFVLV